MKETSTLSMAMLFAIAFLGCFAWAWIYACSGKADQGLVLAVLAAIAGRGFMFVIEID